MRGAIRFGEIFRIIAILVNFTGGRQRGLSWNLKFSVKSRPGIIVLKNFIRDLFEEGDKFNGINLMDSSDLQFGG